MPGTGKTGYCCSKEQALQGQIVIKAVENVTNQAAQVTQAVKEQAAGAEELSGTLQMRENRYARLLLPSKNKPGRDKTLLHLSKMSPTRRHLCQMQ